MNFSHKTLEGHLKDIFLKRDFIKIPITRSGLTSLDCISQHAIVSALQYLPL